MRSTMQDVPLTIAHDLMRYGTTVHGDVRGGHRDRRRRPHARRTPRSAAAPPSWPTPCAASASTGDQRVGTFMWNNAEHLEAYLAVPSMGAVLHTSTSGCSPSSSPTSPTTPRTRSSSSTTRSLPLLAPACCRSCRPSSTSSSPARRRPSADLDALRHRQGGARATRTCSPGQPDDVRLARGRRARRRGDVLHQRHHRQPQGRRLQPPLDLPALDAGLHGRRRSALDRPRPGAADRADVPRQRLGPALRRADDRRLALSCPTASCRPSRCAGSSSASRPTRRGRGADHLERRARLPRRARRDDVSTRCGLVLVRRLGRARSR